MLLCQLSKRHLAVTHYDQGRAMLVGANLIPDCIDHPTPPIQTQQYPAKEKKTP
jgi:hypothetical protein